MSSHLADMMNARVGADCQEKEGCTFYIDLKI
jgi:hypothetical protein